MRFIPMAPCIRSAAAREGARLRRPFVSLRKELRRLLALSLAGPVATFGACRGGGDDASVPKLPDASRGPVEVEGGATSQDAAQAGTDGGDGGNANDANACAPIAVDAGLFGEDGACDKYVYLPCGVPPDLAGSRCSPSVDLCISVCPEGFFFVCDLPAPTCMDGAVVPGAPVYLDCTSCIGANAGRRPVGSRPPRSDRRKRARSARSAGAYFAQLAYAEAASVEAFVQLAARLAAFGAPARLQREALRSAEDEERHARVTGRLARRHGELAASPRPCAFARLTFENFVSENAVEGCVRETFAALVAMHQSARADDPSVAVAMRSIAKDEARHAALAWAIHGWAIARLSPAARARIRASQARALAELRNVARRAEWSQEVRDIAGLPSAAVEREMAVAFGRALFGIGGGGGGCRAQ
jgi:hypothetical protein